MINWSKITKEEKQTIQEIVTRAMETAEEFSIKLDEVDLSMDISATHTFTPLHLEDLLNADDFNFAHDVLGIRKNIDRKTGRLKNCFLPRFAKGRN